MSARVLVREDVGEPGLALLREHFDVETGVRLVARSSSRSGSASFDAILVRSATKLTAELIERGERLRIIARAGVGVDNVDVPAATRRGILVANAPQSNVVTAAEHTMALLLALARNVPQAHASLTAGRWERSQLLRRRALRQAARDPRLRAHRPARRRAGAGVRDAHRRVRPARVGGALPRAGRREGAASMDDVYARADFITLHLPLNDETRGMIDDGAIAKMRDGVRILNVARGGLIDDAALQAGARLRQGRGRRARRVPERADHRLPAVRGLPRTSS